MPHVVNMMDRGVSYGYIADATCGQQDEHGSFLWVLSWCHMWSTGWTGEFPMGI